LPERRQGVPVAEAVAALAGYRGLARRLRHNRHDPRRDYRDRRFRPQPGKCAATLRTLKAHPGRVIAFFQPHGYGPLRQMGHELAEIFARELGPDDVTIFCDPVYFGGTVDRSEGSERIVKSDCRAGGQALHIASREECGAHIAPSPGPATASSSWARATTR
jgi:UDP-N-acetylmuramate--alanine ligase